MEKSSFYVLLGFYREIIPRVPSIPFDSTKNKRKQMYLKNQWKFLQNKYECIRSQTRFIYTHKPTTEFLSNSSILPMILINNRVVSEGIGNILPRWNRKQFTRYAALFCNSHRCIQASFYFCILLVAIQPTNFQYNATFC